MKALVSTFNQEKALVGSFSVIVKTDGSFAALVSSALSGSSAQLGASCNKLQVGIKYFDPAHVVVMRVTAV